MYISRMYVPASVIIHTRVYTHTQGRQVTVAPARRTDSRRVLLDNAPVEQTDGQTNGQTRIYRLLSCPRKKQRLRYQLRQHSIPIEGCFLHDLHHLSIIFLLPSFLSALFFPSLFYLSVCCLRNDKRQTLSVHRVSKCQQKKPINHYDKKMYTYI